MALVVSGTGRYGSRSSGITAASSDYSCCFWVMPKAQTALTGRAPWGVVGPDLATYTVWAGIFVFAGGSTLDFVLNVANNSTNQSTASVTLANDTWAALAYVRTGTSHKFYADGVLIGTTTLDISANVWGQEWIGDDTYGGDPNCVIQNFREWSNDLTLAELRLEWNSDTPVRTTDLVTNTPLASNYDDTTANNNDWAPTGSLSFTTSAICKDTTNSSAATAHTVTLTDTYLQVPATSGGGSQDSWWTYTPTTGQVVLGIFGYAQAGKSYQPNNTIWFGALPTQSTILSTAINVPVQTPVTAGTPVYLRCRDTTGNDASLMVSWLAAPNNTAAVGSLLINDDSNGFPAAVVSSSTGQVLQYRTMVAGESGSAIPSGQFLYSDDFGSTLNLYDSQLGTPTSVPFTWTGPSPAVASALAAGWWYVGDSNGAASLVQTVSSTGTVGGLGQPWNLPTDVVGLGANAAGTILYFTDGSVGATIQRWNLLTNTALSDLAAGVAGYLTYDLLVLGDDTILESYFQQVGHDFKVIHYSAAGAVLNTYNFGVVDTPTPRIGYDALDDTGDFWAMFQLNGVSNFQRIRVSDGAVLADPVTYLYEGGVYQDPPNPTPGRFGVSKCCPITTTFVELPPNPVPPGPSPEPGGATTQTLIPRRMRVTPHLSHEMLWGFHSQLQVDMETGVGLTDPADQGYDPVCMLEWSDDGGHTWSNVHTASVGKIGKYKTRVMFRRLGRSRDRIYRFVMSDPVRANLIAGYLTVEGGTS